jgi:hypothetical protein
VGDCAKSWLLTEKQNKIAKQNELIAGWRQSKTRMEKRGVWRILPS